MIWPWPAILNEKTVDCQVGRYPIDTAVRKDEPVERIKLAESEKHFWRLLIGRLQLQIVRSVDCEAKVAQNGKVVAARLLVLNKESVKEDFYSSFNTGRK